MILVMVSGQIRSGASAIAAMLVQLGVSMGTHMRFPLPPTFRPEWEDDELIDTLPIDLAVGGTELRAFHLAFAKYLERRVSCTKKMDQVTGWNTVAIGVKTPYLLPYWYEASDVAREIGLEPMRVIVTRGAAAVAASSSKTISRLPGMDVLNAKLGELADSAERELAIDYEDAIINSRAVAQRLATLLGVTDERMVRRAARTFMSPTTWPAEVK